MIAKKSHSKSTARLLNLPKGTLSASADADVTVFDPDCEWIFRAEESASKSKNSPFNHWKLKGKVFATIVGGKKAWSEQNELVAVPKVARAPRLRKKSQSECPCCEFV